MGTKILSQKNMFKNVFSKIIGPIKCAADQFQCKAGVCIYSNNANCNGPCILRSWANDKTEDCSDGSDEDNFDYDYEDGYYADHADDADTEFIEIVSKFSRSELNSIQMPVSNTLKLKVI